MRGHRVGVRDVSAVHAGAGRPWIPAYRHDSRQSSRQRIGHLLCGPRGAEPHTSIQQGSNRISVGDCAWRRAGSDIAECYGTSGSNRMRGHRVGVRDVDAMPDGTRSSRHQSDGDDDSRAARQHDTGMVGGSVECEHDATLLEPRVMLIATASIDTPMLPVPPRSPAVMMMC